VSDGLHAAAAGMVSQQAWLDALANDVSNVNTPGYHKVRVGFQELVDGAGSAQVDLGRSAAQGSLQPTGQPLDLAIEGDGYLQVKLADGSTALTRGGSLHLDGRGSLVTADGNELVPPLTMPKGTSPEHITIAADGTVTVAQKKIGQIELVDVPSSDALLSVGNGQFAVTPASGAIAKATGATLQQGSLESSNVDLGESMVSMIEAERAYDLSARALKMQDDLRQIANDIRH
jgi:flagellar basal-body rod protein FlgG